MKPAIFRNQTFQDAARSASESGQWLLVFATAPWCRAGQIMELDAWSDPTVVQRLNGVALCVHMDVNAERNLSARLLIHDLPTTIAFRDEQEHDRITGVKSGAELVAWAERLPERKRSTT